MSKELCKTCNINPRERWASICSECRKATDREKYAKNKNDTAHESAKEKMMWDFLYVRWI